MTSSGFRRSLRGSGAYAIAVLFQRGIGFLLLPLYTRVLSPDEYGQLAVVFTISAGVSTLLSFGLETAVFRTFILLQDTPEKRPAFVNSVGLLALTGPAVLAAITVLVFGDLLASWLSVSSLALGLGIATAAVTVSATALPFAILRAEERLRAYLHLTAIQVVLNTTLTVVLVVALGWGVVGWLLGSLIAITVTLVSGLLMLHHRWTLKVERSYLLATLAFGLPLLPHAAAHWGLSMSDRIVLGASVAPADIGLYQLAYQFAIPVSTLGIAMTRGTAPLYAHAARSEADRRDLAAVVVHHVLIIALLGMTVSILGPVVIDLLMPPEFAGAGEFVPWLVLGSVLLGLYFVPMNMISILAGNTRYVWIATVAAAGINITLNLLTVPRFGALAAAINTAVGYAVLLAGVLIVERGMADRVALDWRRIGLGLAIIASVAVSGLFFTRDLPAWPRLAVGAMIALAGPVLLLASGVWHRPDKTEGHTPRT
ncbi:MAG TPA: oligosaccharide flippase family protein [Candidatus Limnocylindria bacterium]|nr:oligosaccharide flippase family protein [Candidatus Limnocylindria bacterium]